MSTKTRNHALEDEIRPLIEQAFEGMEVEVSHSERWGRPCVTFTWSGFADLLPEERYERLTRVLSEDFRQQKLSGHIWLELAPDEQLDAFLKLPRSEDISGEQKQVYQNLEESKIFDSLKQAMGSDPTRSCDGGFQILDEVLAKKRFSKKRARQAKLLFILHGAYCDCQALLTVRAELAEQFPPGKPKKK